MQRCTLSRPVPAVRRSLCRGWIDIGACFRQRPHPPRHPHPPHPGHSMATQVFISRPVAGLPKSVAFYEAFGYTRNPQFSNDDGACMVISDIIFVMLTTHAKFRAFT